MPNFQSVNDVSFLDQIEDVVITTPTQNQVLNFDGTNWVNSEVTVTTYVRNAEANTLTVGEVVYLFGAQGDRASVKRAKNDSDATSAKTLGIVSANIASNSDGVVTTQGYVSGINLSSYSPGDTLYLSNTAGGMTSTKPYAPNHLVYVGVVARNTNNGILYVRAQNGYELDEIHDAQILSPTAGQHLEYTSSGLWKNTNTVRDNYIRLLMEVV